MYSIKRIPRKLKLGQDYIIYYYTNKKICKFIQPKRCDFNFLNLKTHKCDFNFLNLKTHKCELKQHLYPSKCKNHSSGDWYYIY
jgi:hypothetical protein